MDSLTGINLYSYCGNNPIMYVDSNGCLSKRSAWLISSAMIALSLFFCVTGIGGVLGSILLGAGVGSLVNGYINEAKGDDFTNGYYSGLVSGALCAAGAFYGGEAFFAASDAIDFACLGYLSLGATVSFAGGFLGNICGDIVESISAVGIKNFNIDWKKTLATSTLMGFLNIFAGLGSGMASCAGKMCKSATTLDSKFALKYLESIFSGGTEALYDLSSYLIGEILSAF